MAVVRTTIAYLRPALVDDVVDDCHMALARRESPLRATPISNSAKSDSVTLARAEIDYACIVLSSGKPTRWPPEFHTRYAALPAVLAALA